jgi:hypothetical protein
MPALCRIPILIRTRNRHFGSASEHPGLAFDVRGNLHYGFPRR